MAVITNVREADLTTSPDQSDRAENVGGTGKPISSALPFVGEDISPEVYRQIAEILQQQQNFTLDGYKQLCMKRRIAARIRAIGMTEPENYSEMLAERPDEQQKLLAALSVHVSQFFRNPSTFAALEKKVLPELVERSRSNCSKLRVWSVGCANGEEPYSLALLCEKIMPANSLVSIIGTDLSPDALARAKRGCYEAERLREVPGQLLEKYFLPRGKQLCLAEEIKRKVRFFRHDILCDQPFYRADLILCRNVLIYFSREQQQRILEVLAAALPSGGVLVLGRAETLVAGVRGLFQCVDPAERIYRRLEYDETLLPAALRHRERRPSAEEQINTGARDNL